MATLRQRLSRRNSYGGFDAVHLETSSDLVMRPDGTSIESALTDVSANVTTIINNGTTPTAHASKHATGGSDPITPAAIGAAAANHDHSGYALKDHNHNYAGSSTAGGAATTAVKLQNQRTFKVNLESTVAAGFDGSENVVPGVTGVLPVANGGTGRTDGAAAKLATPRNIRTNLASVAYGSFDGSGDVVPGVTGVLPVANGGTGATSLDALKKSLGVGTSGTGISSGIAVGNTVTWGGYTWIVVHRVGNTVTLALDHIYEKCQANTTSETDTNYAGSNLEARVKAFSATLPTINGTKFEAFVPTKEQMNGGFSYFNSNDRRICRYGNVDCNYWTSSPYTSSSVWTFYHVTKYGELTYLENGTLNNPKDTFGFRPFVAIIV